MHPRHFVAGLASIIIIVRVVWPEIRFDNTSLYLFLLAAIVILIPDIGGMISRIKKFKKGDLEIELETKLKDLAKKTENTEEVIEKSTDDEFEYVPDASRGRILNYTRDPRGGLVAIAVEIESAVEKIAKDYSLIRNKRYVSPVKIIDELALKEILPEELPSLIRDFWTIRNKVFHQTDFTLTNEQLYRLLDLGVRILDLLSVRKKTFPLSKWLRGEDVMRTYGISGNQFLQHIENGLPAYPKDTDIAYAGATPMEMDDVWFQSDYNDSEFLQHELPKWWFKQADIDKYVVSSHRSET